MTAIDTTALHYRHKKKL